MTPPIEHRRPRGRDPVVFTRTRPAIAVVGVVVLLVALMTIPGAAAFGARTAGDEPQYLLTALSLAVDHDIDIANQLQRHDWLAFHQEPLPVQTEPLPDGSQLSPHNVGLPLLLAFPMGIAGWAGAKVALALLAALLAMLLTWLAIRRWRVPPLAAATVVGVFACSPPLSVYATQVYPELPAALAVAVAVFGLTSPSDRMRIVATVPAIVVLPWLAVKFVPLALLLAGFLLWRLRRDRVLVVGSVLALGVCGAGYLAFHLKVYGGWTPYATGDHFVAGEFTAVGDPEFVSRSQRLVGLWADRVFGLIPWQPAYLLGVVALGALLRGRPRSWLLLASVLAVGFGTATFVALTMHGWWWPGRQVVCVLPALLLAIAWWVGGSRRRLLAVLIPGSVGVLATVVLAWETTFGLIRWIVNFHQTADPFFQAMSQVLPDYNTVTGWTWILHVAWLALLVGAAWYGARSAAPQAPRSSGADGAGVDPHGRRRGGSDQAHPVAHLGSG